MKKPLKRDIQRKERRWGLATRLEHTRVSGKRNKQK